MSFVENESQEPPAKKRKTEVNTCAICLEKPANHCFVPCGHKCLCEDCKSHKFNNKQCIICKQQYSMIIKVFDS